MKTLAAVLFEQPGEYEVTEIELDPPKAHEVLIRMVASGICRTDDHFCRNELPAQHLPMCGGHEGGGVIEEVGPGVTGLVVGDHVVTSFVPGCGRCRWCASGMQNMCDNGAKFLDGRQLDGTYRMRAGGEDVGQVGLISTFSSFTVVPEWSCVKVANDAPLESICLLGCAVPTGWGSAVNSAAVSPGQVVIVMGAGGVGMNAVQGARHAGANHVLAVDPSEFKRARAKDFGAHETFDHIDAAAARARELSNGQGADSAIITVGVTRAEHVAAGFRAIRKSGTVVVTGTGGPYEPLEISITELMLYQKRIAGSVLGMTSPSRDVPLLVALYQSGMLKIDELVTRRYKLEEINAGFADLRNGSNIRGVVTFP